jgi:hypothetical protein
MIFTRTASTDRKLERAIQERLLIGGNKSLLGNRMKRSTIRIKETTNIRI